MLLSQRDMTDLCAGTRKLKDAHTSSPHAQIQGFTQAHSSVHAHWLISPWSSTRAIHYEGSDTERTRARQKVRSVYKQAEMRWGSRGRRKQWDTKGEDITVLRESEKKWEKSLEWNRQMHQQKLKTGMSSCCKGEWLPCWIMIRWEYWWGLEIKERFKWRLETDWETAYTRINFHLNTKRKIKDLFE